MVDCRDITLRPVIGNRSIFLYKDPSEDEAQAANLFGTSYVKDPGNLIISLISYPSL